MNTQKGHTLIELIVCLGVIGLIAVGVTGLSASSFGGNNRQRFESECQVIFEKVTEARNTAVMSSDGYGVTIKVYKNSIAILTYQTESNDFARETIRMEQGFITSNLNGSDLVFNGAGVISKGATLIFWRNNKPEKYIVLQPVTGRIYLTDEKPK